MNWHDNNVKTFMKRKKNPLEASFNLLTFNDILVIS